MIEIDERFAELLEQRFRLSDLERHPSSVVGIWPDTRIAYLSQAWHAFAATNDGLPAIASWGLGARYMDAVPEVLRPFYESFFSGVPDADASLHPMTHEYECSSPTLFRKFSMHAFALEARAGFVIVNSLLVERPHGDTRNGTASIEGSRYETAGSVVVQCSHCRRFGDARDPERWDWVPDWVASTPAGTSHGICPTCYDYYYPGFPR